jgi:hypothetical protein
VSQINLAAQSHQSIRLRSIARAGDGDHRSK